MSNSNEFIDFPAQTRISFFKVVEKLQETVSDSNEHIAAYSRSLLEEVKKYPELVDGFEDPKLLVKYKEPIEKLSRILFPDVLLTNEIKALTPPFKFVPFYASTRFQSIMDASDEDFHFMPEGSTPDMLYMFGCVTILNAHYQYPVDMNIPMICEIKNQQTRVTHSYRIAFNADLMEIFPTDGAVDISYEDYLHLIDNLNDLELWKSNFPP